MLYLIKQTIKQNKYMTFSVLTGIYGSLRSFNGSHQTPNDTFGKKVVLAFINGFYYSLYAPYYQVKLIDRIDIKLTNKDPSKYKDSYEDIFSTNYNVFI